MIKMVNFKMIKIFLNSIAYPKLRIGIFYLINFLHQKTIIMLKWKYNIKKKHFQQHFKKIRINVGKKIIKYKNLYHFKLN
jgi:hypothetical protein